MEALHAGNNQINKANRIGKNPNLVLVTFNQTELPLTIKPASYVNQGKPLPVRITKKKPVRCDICQAHGHTRGSCETGQCNCPFCGYGHRYDQCKVRANRHHYYCINCHLAGYNPRGHGAYDHACPVYGEYLTYIDREQANREATRRRISAQVATSLTCAADCKTAAQETEALRPVQPLTAVRKKHKNSLQGGNTKLRR